MKVEGAGILQVGALEMQGWSDVGIALSAMNQHMCFVSP